MTPLFQNHKLILALPKELRMKLESLSHKEEKPLDEYIIIVLKERIPHPSQKGETKA